MKLLFQIHVKSNENLPKNFCYNCTKSIEQCYSFIQRAHDVDVALKNISRSKTIIVELENLKEEQNNLKSIPDKYDNAKDDDQVCDIKDNGEFECDFSEELEYCNNLNEEDNKKDDVRESIDIVNKYTCPICQKCFTSKKWYSRHLEKEQGSKFCCPHCSKGENR